MKKNINSAYFVSLLLRFAIIAAIFAVAPVALTQPVVDVPPQFRGSSHVIPGRYVVVFKDHIANPAAEAAKLMHSQGGEIHYTYSHAIRGFAATIPDAAYHAIQQNPNVASITPDITIYPGDVQIQSDATWGLDRIDQGELPLNKEYHYNHTGSGVRVYVIDSGIHFSHEDFAGRAVLGKDFIDDDLEGGDCNGHGTHVAGTIGGATWGVAKEVELVSVRVFSCRGDTSGATVIAAIDWVTENGQQPAVVNMSLGGGFFDPLNTAVANSVNAGFVYSVSAGNDNADACNYSPASTAEALTVGSTTSLDARSSFSNYGACVDLFAPGTSITSTWYTSNTATHTLSGTSMSAPHVAGVAALMLEQHPIATPTEIGAAMLEGATQNIVTNSNSANDHLLHSLVEIVPPALSTPTVLTGTVSNLTDDSATVSGNVTSAGSEPISERGICFALKTIDTDEQTLPSDCVAASTTGTGSFQVDLTGLEADTDYNALAYAQNKIGIAYGDEIRFTTLPPNEAPVVESLSSTSSRSGPWTNVDASWRVSDDVALATVKVELLNGSTVLEDSNISVSGTQASGTTSLRSRSGADGLRLTVTDAAGKSTTLECGLEQICSSSPSSEDDPPNEPPSASFIANCTDLTCKFDGSSSNDPDGGIVGFAWSFGDDKTDSGKTVSHTYAATGTYTVTLTVTSDDGATDSTSKDVTVAEASDDEDTTLPTVDFNIVNTSAGPWTRFDVNWTAEDETALASIRVELLNDSNAVDSVTTAISGTSASGTSSVRTRGSATDVRVTVTDAAGNQVVGTKSVP